MPSKTFKRNNVKSKNKNKKSNKSLTRNSKRSSRSKKMLSNVRKMKGGGLEFKDFIKAFNDKSVMFHQFFSEKEEIIKTLQYIYDNNTLESFFDSGTTKLVFLPKQDNKVFKILITFRDELGRMIKEPMYMLSSSFCNKPMNINVYCENKNNCEIDNITINNCDLVKASIITWYEEKALQTDTIKFKNNLDLLSKFMKETKSILEVDGFRDLGPVNVGLFINEPKFRWIDIQPKPEPENIKLNKNCLYLD